VTLLDEEEAYLGVKLFLEEEGEEEEQEEVELDGNVASMTLSAQVTRSLHTSAYVSIRQYTSAYISIRPHASPIPVGVKEYGKRYG